MPIQQHCYSAFLSPFIDLRVCDCSSGLVKGFRLSGEGLPSLCSLRTNMTRVVFFQGVMASMLQLMRYNGMFTDTERRYPSNDLPEVVHEWTLNPIYLLGMFVSTIIFWWRRQSFTPSHAIRVSLLNIGQSADVMRHQERLAEAQASGEPLICFGVSRGAMTTFISLASHQNHTNIKLALLEGSPDSIPNVLEARYGRLGASIAERIISFFTMYDPKIAREKSALALVSQFPNDIPIGFVTSERDLAVPALNTLRLAQALIQAGHPNVHILVLKHASHDAYWTGHPEDRQAYADFVSLLREKYKC